MLVIEEYTEDMRKYYYLKSERKPGYVYFGEERMDFNVYLSELQDKPLRDLLEAYYNKNWDKECDCFPLYENRDKPEGEIFEMVKQGLA